MRHISTAAMRQGEVITPEDVERELAYIVEQLEGGTALLIEVSERLATNEVNLQLRMAATQLRSQEKSLDRRNAEAITVNADLWREVQLDKSRQRLIRDTQHDLRAELEAVRSIGTSVRSSMFDGSGQGGQASSGRQQEPRGRSLDGDGRPATRPARGRPEGPDGHPSDSTYGWS